MIISRHKVCDICEEPVGVNKRYFIIKSKNYLVGYAGGWSDNKTHHICEDCMQEFATYLQSKLGRRCGQMIIEIPDDNSIVKWKRNDKEDWKSAEISDLIKAYEETSTNDAVKESEATND